MLSVPHLIVIFIVALMIFGPEKLPELARMLGKATAEFRKLTTDFRYALEQEVQDLDRQARIREEEVRAGSPQTQPDGIQPEGAMPRLPTIGKYPSVDVVTLPPEPDSAPEAVPPPPEKPPDDNAAS